MGAIDTGWQRGSSAAGPPPGAAPAPRGPNPGQGAAPAAGGAGSPTKFVLCSLIALALGAATGYWLAAAQFREQAVAIAQASQLQVDAANQRIRQLQEQQRQFAEQVGNQQRDIVEQADEQQRKIVRQVSEQERALLAQQQALMQQAKERERDLAKPDLPVKVWVRKASAGAGLVPQMHNFGTQALALAISTHSTVHGPQEVWHTVIAPNATQVIGADPGWALAPGDDLELDADGFRQMTFHIRVRAKMAQSGK
jgi:hypothetical protein